MRELSHRLESALQKATARLLMERNAKGHWDGELSSSALSTATAVTALATYSRECPESRESLEPLIAGGLQWLADNVNVDGGWGDTVKSVSNISTTALCWAAFGVGPGADQAFSKIVTGAQQWLEQASGGFGRDRLARAIIARYGKDRTFSVPILTMCALTGRLGEGREAWRHVIPLPFELAAFPQRLFAALRLPVVSYALPALIAIGQARHHHAPSRNPFSRLLRSLARARTLEVLTRIQPENGGFLEATPLTSFVTMSLAASGNAPHTVTRKAIEFLLASVRSDGSWPIDTNLATWVTTLSVNAFHGHPPLPATERGAIQQWLLSQQYRTTHPYTNAAPGGWAWTPLPGGVPDADDTAGALLALHVLGCEEREPIELGIQWLLDLQNSDGGIPTFCRGWTNLPFDRSSPDLTAHALRAWKLWRPEVPAPLGTRMDRAIRRAILYLLKAQKPAGEWLPLWFGNQHDPNDENHVYGTARVIAALSEWLAEPRVSEAVERGLARLIEFQLPDGSWRGSGKGASSVEETGLAVEALSLAALCGRAPSNKETFALRAGVEWLCEAVEKGSWETPSPIGFYFARLWYFERLYPIIFAVGALTAANRAIGSGPIRWAAQGGMPRLPGAPLPPGGAG